MSLISINEIRIQHKYESVVPVNGTYKLSTLLGS